MKDQRLENRLRETFGFESFKQGQKEVISKILDDQSALAVFPTGSGKSLCYQLSAMLRSHMTLVVSPLISLMQDQLAFLLRHDIPAALLNSALEKTEYNDVLQKAKEGALKILMISVERFKNERFRLHLEKMMVSLMVVDEAHCISEWGHNFRPDYLKLPLFLKEFNIPQVLLLTATATQKVVDDMCRKFDILKENAVVTGFYRSNLFLQVTPTAESEKAQKLLERISESPDAPTIIYVTLQKTAEEIARFLCEHHIDAGAYHAGMKNEARTETQNRFMQGKLNCVVATIAFGMGIDRRDIGRIIHYDLPKSIENYGQEIGRSGRDGRPSFCEVLANRDNITVLENFVYGDTPGQDSIRQLLAMIKDNPDDTWQIKLNTLMYELNIRMLPLKTLLVYIEMEGIISPKYTKFEEYAFKYRVDPSGIAAHFQGERKAFVEAVMAHCETKKIWTYAAVSEIEKNYGADRKRIISALEYFAEKGWIDLESKRAVEVFDIKTREFDSVPFSEELHRLFLEKERHEIKRIHKVIQFFESDTCLSKTLAGYFGDRLTMDRCGHCSFCSEGRRSIPYTMKSGALSHMDFVRISSEFAGVVEKGFTATEMAKFLCGISSPMFVRFKITKHPRFGSLEKYPFPDVKSWIQDAVEEVKAVRKKHVRQ